MLEKLYKNKIYRPLNLLTMVQKVSVGSKVTPKILRFFQIGRLEVLIGMVRCVFTVQLSRLRAEECGC